MQPSLVKAESTLVQKYNVAGPRYTSYPTAVQFVPVGEKDAKRGFAGFSHPERESDKLSLYFHIPFCFSLCWYCGCTKIITKDTDRGDSYISYLEKEMDLMLNTIGINGPVTQIHFGGGTPTFLRPDQNLRLGSAIRSRFEVETDAEFSVEIDPRKCSREHVSALKSIGCNRASLGVQDTNPDVQKAIHRIQPFEQTQTVANYLREEGIEELNVDLIYGLPKQTPATFMKSIEDVLQIKPNRMALYSYAHIPSAMPSQRLLNEDDLPSPDEKIKMITSASDFLPDHGMQFIGMDHFARHDDSLSKALEDGSLHRNFQGYSTHAGAQTLAFGMSGISQLHDRYIQNTKDLAQYYNRLDEGKLPAMKHLLLTRDDLIRKDLIMRVMCKPYVSFAELSKEWGIDAYYYFQDELKNLKPLQKDGLLIQLPDEIYITNKGRYFLRNIAMVFDTYLKPENQKRFSKTV